MLSLVGARMIRYDSDTKPRLRRCFLRTREHMLIAHRAQHDSYSLSDMEGETGHSYALPRKSMLVLFDVRIEWNHLVLGYFIWAGFTLLTEVTNHFAHSSASIGPLKSDPQSTMGG